MSSELHKRISKSYSKYFFEVKPPKDEILDLVSILISLQIFMLFYLVFKNDRGYFGVRFIFDCIHFTFFEFNGILVSDKHLEQLLDKYIDKKFLNFRN
jgi:hypothetical protein